MGLFNIIYSNLPPQLLPVRLRKSVHKAWLRTLVNGSVLQLYNTFFANRTANIYYLAHTSQVCYIEAALNDAFDPTLRRIYISDPNYRSPHYTYLDIELASTGTIDPVAKNSEIGAVSYDAPIYLFSDSEMSLGYAGFIVYVPTVLGLLSDVNLSNQLFALVNKYRLPGKSDWVAINF
jgi:hypothetical protein